MELRSPVQRKELCVYNIHSCPGHHHRFQCISLLSSWTRGRLLLFHLLLTYVYVYLVTRKQNILRESSGRPFTTAWGTCFTTFLCHRVLCDIDPDSPSQALHCNNFRCSPLKECSTPKKKTCIIAPMFLWTSSCWKFKCSSKNYNFQTLSLSISWLYCYNQMNQ